MNTARGHVPVHAKAISYNVDGTGRDTYISFNNGGISKSQRIPAFSTSGRFSRPTSASGPARVRLEAKTIHYHSDGTGRDQYIVTNEGGFTSGRGSKQNFLNSLRSYEKLRPVTRDRIDYFEWAQHKMSMKELDENRQRAATIRDLVNRLSSPKAPRTYSSYYSPRTTKIQHPYYPSRDQNPYYPSIRKDKMISDHY